jgi:cytochrome c oxidase assembly protein subunit 15
MGGTQVTLGISTLLMHVPVNLAAAHQAGSLTLLTICLYLRHAILRSSMANAVASEKNQDTGEAPTTSTL